MLKRKYIVLSTLLAMTLSLIISACGDAGNGSQSSVATAR